MLPVPLTIFYTMSSLFLYSICMTVRRVEQCWGGVKTSKIVSCPDHWHLSMYQCVNNAPDTDTLHHFDQFIINQTPARNIRFFSSFILQQLPSKISIKMWSLNTFYCTGKCRSFKDFHYFFHWLRNWCLKCLKIQLVMVMMCRIVIYVLDSDWATFEMILAGSDWAVLVRYRKIQF